MRIMLSLEEAENVLKSIEIEVQPTESLASVVGKATSDFDTDVEDVLECLALVREHDAGKETIGHYLRPGDNKLRFRLVCIDLHFEGESAIRRFSPSRKWGAVHRWGCKKFMVAEDACPNLQLREDKSDGNILNENKRIGEFPGCKQVWLVAPGPEQNGR